MIAYRFIKPSIMALLCGLYLLNSQPLMARPTNTGTITIVHQALPADGTDFTFTLTQPPTTPHAYSTQTDLDSLDTPAIWL